MKYNLKAIESLALDIREAKELDGLSSRVISALDDPLRRDGAIIAMKKLMSDDGARVRISNNKLLLAGKVKRFFIEDEILQDVALANHNPARDQPLHIPFEIISVVLVQPFTLKDFYLDDGDVCRIAEIFLIDATTSDVEKSIFKNNSMQNPFFDNEEATKALEELEKVGGRKVIMACFEKWDEEGGSGCPFVQLYPEPTNISENLQKLRKFGISLCKFITAQNIEVVSQEKERTSIHDIRSDGSTSKEVPQPLYWLRVKHPSTILTPKELSSKRLHHGFNYQFDVRGHYRHFYSPRFTNKKGTTRWIGNHRRGSGIYIPKNYVLDSGNHSNANICPN